MMMRAVDNMPNIVEEIAMPSLDMVELIGVVGLMLVPLLDIVAASGLWFL